MIDPFVILAPVLLLAVVALLRFIGCKPFKEAPYADEPTFNPPPGPYTVEQWVVLSTTTANAKIHLTTDGTTPSKNSPAYSVPIKVSTTTTIKAFVDAPGFAPSPVVDGIYIFIFLQPPPPTLVTVTFSGPEPTTPTGSRPQVPYKNLAFDANWAWERNTPENILNHVYFQPGRTSGSFTFDDGPKFLKSLKVSAGPAGTITVSDNNGQTQTQGIPVTTGQSVFVPINWPMKSTTVTVSFTIQNSMGIDTIVYAL